MIDLEAVVFDYGNVLCAPQIHSDLSSMAEACGLSRQELEPLYWRFRDKYDVHEIDGPAYWRLIAGAAQIQLSAGQIEQAIKLDCQSWSRPSHGMLSWVSELKSSGFKTAILSNMPPEIRVHLDTCDWLKDFHHKVYSCDIKAIKPEEKIYRHCLTLLGLEPERVLFLDDRAPNVDGALAIGMHALLFVDADQISREIGHQFKLPRLTVSAI